MARQHDAGGEIPRGCGQPTNEQLSTSDDESTTSDSFMDDLARISILGSRRGASRALCAEEMLKHYRILGKLGEGGMGVVYAALDMTLGREVALKVLPTVDEPDRKRRFLREARLLAALKHPNIVPIYEVGEAPGGFFIAMERIHGKTLRARLADGPLPLEEAVRIASDVARGLAEVHRVGIVHRDVKPENVMIDEHGHVTILDFGLAKISGAIKMDGISTTTDDGHLLGTPSYMAPEQAAGTSVDSRADVFSLGVMFYEMLTGQRPFRGASNLEVLIAIARDDPTPPSRLAWRMPATLERVVLRCLLKDPVARYADGAELLQSLDLVPSRSLGSHGVMHVARRAHVMVQLSNGRVLMAGGVAGTGVIDTAEIYDPSTGESASTPPMGAPVGGRFSATATLLQDGTVLVAGGGHSKGVQNSAQVYEPMSNSWRLPFSYMNHYRFGHSATLFPDGNVFVVGGYGGGYHCETEIYDWATRRWTLMAPISSTRSSHTATMFTNGRVLVAGGYNGQREIHRRVALATTEIYDPATDTWESASPMMSRRAGHTATLLTNGRVLVVGGVDEKNVPLGAELYDPLIDRWEAVPMRTPRSDHSATLLADGAVFVAGGSTAPMLAIGSVEVYDPNTNTWTEGAPLSTPRAGHRALLLADTHSGSRILVAGGFHDGMTLHTTELIESRHEPAKRHN